MEEKVVRLSDFPPAPEAEFGAELLTVLRKHYEAYAGEAKVVSLDVKRNRYAPSLRTRVRSASKGGPPHGGRA